MAVDDDLIFRGSASADRPTVRPVYRSAKASAGRSTGRSANPSGDQSVRDSVWTLPILCLGLGIIACCILVPASDVNRRLVAERVKLQRDLDAVEKQTDVNVRFLKLVNSDPELAERLAQRQMKFIRQGTKVLQVGKTPGATHSADQMSPFLLTAMPGAAPMSRVVQRPGLLGKLSGDVRLQLYATGLGLMLLAIGLVLSGSPPSPADVGVDSD